MPATQELRSEHLENGGVMYSGRGSDAVEVPCEINARKTLLSMVSPSRRKGQSKVTHHPARAMRPFLQVLPSPHIQWSRVPQRTFLLQILGGMPRWLEREEIVWRSVEGVDKRVAPFNIAEIKGQSRVIGVARRVVGGHSLWDSTFKAMPRRI
ncbi:hypothetical protein DFH09DRAFT_1289118 [Mycena vulgaris]|nr:hypothetical protein DFH09DRAFT_1289118 [Mycena vulgaris]